MDCLIKLMEGLDEIRLEPDNNLKNFVSGYEVRPFTINHKVLGGMLLLLFSSTLVDANNDIASHYGSTMPTDVKSVPIDQAISEFVSSDEPIYRKFTGRITEVCKKKGCWMVLMQGSSYARVTFKDYGFFVPTDSNGSKALVYGRLNEEKFNQDKSKHYEEDVGKNRGINSDSFGYLIEATSVFISK